MTKVSKPHISTIELNGKVYDIKNSRPAHGHNIPVKVHHPPVAENPKSTPKPIPVKVGKVLDGVVRKKHVSAHHAAPAAAKKVQRSKTLMRSAVKKPTVNKAN